MWSMVWTPTIMVARGAGGGAAWILGMGLVSGVGVLVGRELSAPTGTATAPSCGAESPPGIVGGVLVMMAPEPRSPMGLNAAVISTEAGRSLAAAARSRSTLGVGCVGAVASSG